MKKFGLSLTSLGLASLISLVGCDDSGNEFVDNKFTPSQVIVASAGPNSMGVVTQFDSRELTGDSNFNPMVNGSLVINGGDDLFGVTSSISMAYTSPGITVATNVFNRSLNFNLSIDSKNVVAGLAGPTGIENVDSRGMVLVGESTSRTVFGIGQRARGTDGTPAPAVFQTAAFAASAVPLGIAYDNSNDRLYVSLNDGTIAVFDTFFASGPSGASPTSILTIQIGGNAAVNITFLKLNGDSLFLADAGVQNVADGAIAVINGITAKAGATGTVSTNARISGTNSRLVDPTGIAFANNNNLFVSDVGANRVFNFGQSLANGGGNVGPLQQRTVSMPTGFASRIGGPKFTTDNNDLDSAVGDFTVIFTNNASGTGRTLGQVDGGLANIGGITFTIDSDLGGPMNVENCVVDNLGNVFVTADDGSNTTGTGGLLSLGVPFNGRMSAINPNNTGTDWDSVITGGNTQFKNPKGFDVCRDRGVIIIVENDQSSPAADAPQIIVYGFNASGNVTEFGRTTNLGLAGRRPWDCDYNKRDDRLYVACTDGTLIVYDNFLTTKLGGTSSAAPERVITPSDGLLPISVNLHGVIYNDATDQLILSDVGSAAVDDDGQIFVVNNAKFANGLTKVSTRIRGANSMLGNPVDIVNNGDTLFVAEKANGGGRILRFDNIFGRGDTMTASPDAMITTTAPESVSIAPGLTLAPAPMNQPQ
ncbi:MAG: hypothetical protein P1V97_21515 [Planctomycetota bacterium]|nr:hypothetical protein [Planctomycetota bacterium]